MTYGSAPSDDHLHRLGPDGDGLADLAEADDPERAPAQLQAGELGPLPLAPADRGIRGRRPACHAIEQRERVLGRRDRVAGRGIHDGDARARGRLEIDVVDPHAGPTDDDESGPRGDERRVHLDLAANDQCVVVGDDGRQLGRRQAGPFVDLVVRGEELQSLARDRLGDEDPHAPAPVGVRVAMPSASRAAACAAPTATPGVTVRPLARQAISSVLSAPRISSSVTDPRWPSRKILPVSLPWPRRGRRPAP